MKFVENALGRHVPVEIEGRELIPYKGAFTDPISKMERRKYANSLPKSHPEWLTGESKLCKNLEDAVKRSGLTNGMTISFHHHLRNGDYVVNMVLNVCDKLGIKDLNIAPSALFPIHKPVIDYIRNGVVRNIHGSMNGPVGKFVSYGGLPGTAVLRTHGGRVRAIEDGDLEIDVAFIAAPCADDFGNANGVYGPSACGPLAYSYVDAMYADKVVIVTDNLVEYPCLPISIPSTHVDYVAVVDKIGNPEGIVSGTLRITHSPTRLYIANLAAKFIRESPYYKNNMSFQTGAGGISLAITKDLGEFMEQDGITASFINGGITKFSVELFKRGLVRKLLDGQVFDPVAIKSFRDDLWHQETPMTMYANIHSKGCLVNRQDIGFLGATEVDLDFNVNVNTHSDGLLLHGIGGHTDVAAGAKLAMIVIPSYRKRIPVLRKRVTTVTTPGETIDVIVTELGIAINPLRKDLIEHFKNSKLPISSIEDIYSDVMKIVGGEPEEPKLKERIIALIEYRDGTIIDVVRQVEGQYN